MTRTIWLTLLLLTFSMGPDASAYSKDEPRETSSALPAAEPTPSEMLAFALTLFGFLGLIATNLVRWSSDLSWKERSVFSASQEGSRKSFESSGS